MKSTIKTNETNETNEGTMNLPELAAYCAQHGYNLLLLAPDALEDNAKRPTLILPPDATAGLLSRQAQETQGLAAFARKVRAEGLVVHISEDGKGAESETRLNYTWNGFLREIGAAVEEETPAAMPSA